MQSTGAPFEIRVTEAAYEVAVVVRRARVKRVANGNGYFDEPAKTENDVLAKFEVTGSDLERTLNKAKLHLDLLEDA